jgi:hypothetical protein
MLCLLCFRNGSPDNLRQSGEARADRMTVTLDHGLPVCVGTLQAFNSTAASFADRVESSAKTGRRPSARRLAAALVAANGAR